MGVAVYDMDKTITSRPSWMAWLLFYARHEAPWRLLLLPAVLGPLLLYVVGALGRKGLKEQMQGLLMGKRVPLETVARRAEEFAASFGARMERPAALEQIGRDRAAGHRLVMATASCRFYAEALAKRWGFDDVVATRNVIHDGWLTNRIEGQNCYGMPKLAMILGQLNEVTAPTAFYSDHESDAPGLLWADRPVAVSPSKELRRQAAEMGWPAVWWW